MRDHFLHALKLTTSNIKVRNDAALLSDMYPCIICEDIETIGEYKVRLIFGLNDDNGSSSSSYDVDFTGFYD